MEDFLRSAGLLATMLNPFLMTVFLIDLVESLDTRAYANVILRASLISGSAFALCAVTGEALFNDVLQTRFSAFLIFGGVVILGVAIRFIFFGAESLSDLRGPPEQIAGSIAMPFMIGPGTISTSMMAGSRLPLPMALAAVAGALLGVAAVLVALKMLHDWVRRENEPLLARWVDVTGRVMALIMGTYAVDLVLRGIESWLGELPG